MAFLHGRGWHSKETQASSSNGNGITYTLATLSKSSGKSEKELSRLDPTSHNHLIQMLSDFFYVKVQDPTTSEYATMAAAILKYHPFFADSLLDIQCCVSCFSIRSNYIARTIHSFNTYPDTESSHSTGFSQETAQPEIPKSQKSVTPPTSSKMLLHVCHCYILQEPSVFLKLYYMISLYMMSPSLNNLYLSSGSVCVYSPQSAFQMLAHVPGKMVCCIHVLFKLCCIVLSPVPKIFQRKWDWELVMENSYRNYGLTPLVVLASLLQD